MSVRVFNSKISWLTGLMMGVPCRNLRRDLILEELGLNERLESGECLGEIAETFHLVLRFNLQGNLV